MGDVEEKPDKSEREMGDGTLALLSEDVRFVGARMLRGMGGNRPDRLR